MTYEKLVAALLSDVGAKPVPMSDLPAPIFHDWELFASEITRHPGPSDFMLFHLIDHSGWLQTAGVNRKALRAIIGNPLIAITTLQHDLTAGLFAPVELLLVKEDHDRSGLSYVRPSPHTVVDDNPPLAAAALALDAKLAALAAKVAASGAGSTPSLAPPQITNHAPMPASSADNSIGGAS